jgi:hypothetical protein
MIPDRGQTLVARHPGFLRISDRSFQILFTRKCGERTIAQLSIRLARVLPRPDVVVPAASGHPGIARLGKAGARIASDAGHRMVDDCIREAMTQRHG